MSNTRAARPLLVDGLLAVPGLERVLDRVGAVAGVALGAEAVHVGAVAEAEVVLLALGLGGLLAPLLDEGLRVAGVRGDHAAEVVDPRHHVGGAPAVAGHRARVALGLEQRHHRLARAHAQVVGVDDHPLGDQPPDQVLAQVGESAGVAARAVRIDRRHAHRQQVLDRVAEQVVVVVVVQTGLLAVDLVGRAGTGLHLPVLAGGELVAVVHDRAGRARCRRPRRPARCRTC